MSPAPINESPDRRSRWTAVAECAVAASVYMLIAFGGLRFFDVSGALGWLTGAEAEVISGFIVGSLGQLAALVLIWLVARPRELAEAFGATRRSSTSEGWLIALAIVAVEAGVMFGLILDVGRQALLPSAVNLTGSIAPLLDGVTQEIFFRGYLILRLRRGGHGLFVQLLVSSLAFAAIHIGYVGEGWSQALPPLLGTLGLGAALGWAFIRGGHSLRPPILAHMLILVLVQPWLAMAR